MGFEIKLDGLNGLGDIIRENGNEESVKIIREVSLAILTDVVYNTRWKTGLMRNNWRLTRNKKWGKTIRAMKSGNDSLRSGASAAARIVPTDKFIVIENNVEYAAAQNAKQGGILEQAIKRHLKGN